jgi:atypical dual specificity phosphatase
LGTGGIFLRKIRARVSDEPTGFVWVEKGKLAGTGYPSSKGQVQWLVAQGIASILTLTPDPLPREYTAGLPLVFGHVPMQDHSPPSIPELEEAVSYIEGRLKDGKAVAVHCLAGEGRTGCVMAAYLIATRNLSADEAMATLRELKPGFVEWQQEKSINEFAAKERLTRKT